jgi:hypothetical protein
VADGSITAAKLAPNAVTTGVIENGAVTATKLGDDAVGSAKVADGTIRAADLATEVAGADATTGALAAGACEVVTSTAPAVKDKDLALVFAGTGIPDGLIAQPLVADKDGELKLRVCNITPGPLAPASFTYGFVVLH